MTIASAGNASDFGDLSKASSSNSACADSTKAVIATGTNASTNALDSRIIASTANATDFGDLTVARIFTVAFCNGVPSGAS